MWPTPTAIGNKLSKQKRSKSIACGLTCCVPGRMLRIWPISSYELVTKRVRVRVSEGVGLLKGLGLR